MEANPRGQQIDPMNDGADGLDGEKTFYWLTGGHVKRDASGVSTRRNMRHLRHPQNVGKFGFHSFRFFIFEPFGDVYNELSPVKWYTQQYNVDIEDVISTK